MNKLIFILLAGILVVSSCKSKQATTETASTEVATTANKRQAPPQRGEGSLEERKAKMEEVYSNIGLSADQKAKMTAIETKYASQLESAKGSGREAMKSVMDSKMTEISSVLSAEQLTKYKAAMDAMREKRGGERGR
jgi:Spy/CpxP family protein refolding chaperone